MSLPMAAGFSPIPTGRHSESLKQAKVGVTPGIDFGSGGEGFLRFSYATSLENIKEGLNRLEKYLKRKSNH